MTEKRIDTWMPFYIGAYVADTMRFTAEQHGAYLLLILDYWRNGPPPDDDEILAQITKLPPDRWAKARAVLAPKFRIEGGVWRHKRIEEELAAARNLVEGRSRAGKASAEARRARSNSTQAEQNANKTRTKVERRSQQTANKLATKGQQKGRPTPSPTPTPTQLPVPTPPPMPGELLAPPAPPESPGRPATSETAAVWAAYSEAMRARYGVAPPRNLRVNTDLAGLVRRVGAQDAPAVAAFYVGLDEPALYRNARHPTNLLVRDAEGLYVAWKSGARGTAPPPGPKALQEARNRAAINEFVGQGNVIDA